METTQYQLDGESQSRLRSGRRGLGKMNDDVKRVSFRIRRVYYDQIVVGAKREELRRDCEFWRKRLIGTDNLPTIAVFVCGKDTHRREITGIRIDKPERVLGRELSAQGKQDIPTDTCIVVSLGKEICPY